MSGAGWRGVGRRGALAYDSPPMPLVARNLSKAYGPLKALDGVSFEIAAGEVFGLLGPNGAGKTTTVECLVGLSAPDAGEIEICGLDLRRQGREARAQIGVALQTTGLQDTITPREALAAYGVLYPKASPAAELLARFGLTEKADARFETLSGGQKQRTALALAFLNDPAVVVLDEPTAGLDPLIRRELHEEIRRMRQEGRAVLLTTHDMDEAEQLCDRLAVMDRGRIVAQGAPAELIASSRAATAVEIQANGALPADWAHGLRQVRDVTSEGASARFNTDNLNEALAELAAVLSARDLQLTAVRAGKASLEDVIVDLTGRGR